MRFRDLEYVVAVAEELHFGRAARRLHMSQPPLSQQIRALEEQLGARLFDRTSQKVSLTAAGKVFVEDAVRLLNERDQAVEHVRAVARGKAGRIRVGFVFAANVPRFMHGLMRFKRDAPDVELVLFERATLKAVEEIRTGHLDLAFVRRAPGTDLSGLMQQPYLCDRHMLALPSNHHLARLREIDVALLRDEPFIIFPREILPNWFDLIMSIFHEAGFTPTIVQEAVSVPTIRGLVAAGMGVSILPQAVEWEERAGMCYRPLKGFLPRAPVVGVWRKGDDSPLVWRLLDEIITGGEDWEEHRTPPYQA